MYQIHIQILIMGEVYIATCKAGASFKVEATDRNVVQVNGIGSLPIDAEVDHLGSPIRNADQIADYIDKCYFCYGQRSLCFLYNYSNES